MAENIQASIRQMAFSLWEQIKLGNNSGPEYMIERMKNVIRLVVPEHRAKVWTLIIGYARSEAINLSSRAKRSQQWADLCSQVAKAAPDVDFPR